MAGPTIAYAEVDVTLDGSRMVRQAARLARAAARQFSTVWSDRLRPALLRATARMDGELRHAFANVFRAVGETAADAMRAGFNSRGAQRLLQAVDQQLGRIETEVLHWSGRMRATMATAWNGIAEAGRDAWGNLGDEVAKQTTRIRVETRGLAASIANTFVNMRETLAPGAWDRWGETLRYHLTNIRVQARLAGDAFERFGTRARASVSAVTDAFANLGRSISGSRIGRSLTELGRVLGTRFRRVGKDSGDQFSEGMSEAVADGARDTARVVERELGRTVRNVDRQFKGVFGSMRGARNDFVNLVGIVGSFFERLTVSGLNKLFTGVGTALGKIGGAISGIGAEGNVFSKLGAQVESFGSIVGSLATASGPIITTVIAIGVFANTLFLLVPIMGAVAAGIYAVTGAFTALLAVVAGAALGALVSLGPILFAAAAGAGALTLGILGLSDEMKKGFKPLEDWYDTTKTMVAERLFADLEKQSGRWADGLAELNPILADSADKLRVFATELLGAFQEDRTKKVLAPLAETLPEILENLLDTVKELSTAFSSVFAAASPIVAEVTENIAKGAKEFADWAESAKGQAEIREFMEKAAEAAEALWDILVNVGDALGTIFDEGSDTGQKFLDKLVEITEKFAEWLDTPEGRDELNEWFTSAENLAVKLEDILTSLKDTFDKLNTPENRQLFFRILDGVEALIVGIGWLAEQWDTFWDNVYSVYMTVKNMDWVALGKSIVEGVLEGLQAAWTALEEWWNETWDAIVQSFKDFFGIASPSTLFAGFGEDIIEGLLQGLETGWQNIVTFFSELPTRVTNFFLSAGSWLIAYGGMMLDGLRQGLEQRWVDVATWFTNLPTRIRNFFASAGSWLIAQGGMILSGLRQGLEQRWVDIVLFFSALPARIRGFFSTAGSWLLAQGGQVLNGFRQGLVDRWEAVRDWFDDLPAKVKSAVGNMDDVLIQAGRDVINGFLQGVRDRAATARTEISNLATSLASAAAAALGIASPSKVFAKIGEQVVDGLVLGIDSNANAAVSAVSNLGAQMSSAWGMANPMRGGSTGAVVASGGGGGSGNTVIVEAGAIQYVTPLSDPRLVAIQSLDELVVRLGG